MLSSTSSPASVFTVLLGGGAQARDLLSSQERPSDELAIGTEGLSTALRSERRWLWVLDGSARPHPGALAALLGAAEAVADLGSTTLLASKVLAADGSLAVGLTAWPRRGNTELTIAAVARGVYPVRAAHGCSLLIDRAAAARQPIDEPTTRAAFVRWTARLLRQGTGYLVPASVVTATGAIPASTSALSVDPEEDLCAGVALLRDAAWHPLERVWLGAEVLQRAGTAVARRPASLPALVRGAGRGLRRAS